MGLIIMRRLPGEKFDEKTFFRLSPSAFIVQIIKSLKLFIVTFLVVKREPKIFAIVGMKTAELGDKKCGGSEGRLKVVIE